MDQRSKRFSVVKLEKEKPMCYLQQHQVGGPGVPPLLDLCLYVVCQHIDGCKYLNVLPDYVQQRLCLLFKQVPAFQEKLGELNLSYCYQLTDEELKSIAYLKNLTKLNLSHCDKLTGIGLSYIGSLTKLKALCLNHCTKVSLGFYFLQPLNQLTRLELSFCEIQDPVMPFITNKTSLKHLNLMCNRLTDEGCAALRNLTSLTSLSLSMNPLITDNTLHSLHALTNLTSLNINFCKQLTGEGIKQLSKALDSNLKQLDMIGCDRALNEGNNTHPTITLQVKTRPLILLAEDSKIQARMITMVLNRYNFDVEVATNGEMALEMFRENPKYDLILMVHKCTRG